MFEAYPTAGRRRRSTRCLVAGAVFVVLVLGTGCGDGSTATTGAGGATPPATGAKAGTQQPQHGAKGRLPK
jgi:hypothetical protein